MNNEQNNRGGEQIGATWYTFLSAWFYHGKGVRKGCEHVFANADGVEVVIWRSKEGETYQRLKKEIDLYKEWRNKNEDALDGFERIRVGLVDDEKKVCYIVTEWRGGKETLKDRKLKRGEDVAAFFSCLKKVLKLGGEIQEDPEAYFWDGALWRARGVVRGKNSPSGMLKLVECVQGSRHDKKRLISKLRVSKGSDELDESKLNEIEKDCLKIVSGSSNGGWRKIMVAIAIVLLVFASYFAIFGMKFERALWGKEYNKAAEILKSGDEGCVSKENRDQLAREWCEHIRKMYDSGKSDEEGYKEWEGLFAGSHKDLAERLKEARRGYEARQHKREQINGALQNYISEKMYLKAAEILKSGDEGCVSKENRDKLAREWCEHTCEMYDSGKSDGEGYEKWEGLFEGSHRDLAERLKEARRGYEARQHKRDQINGELQNYISEMMYLKAAEILKSGDEGCVSKENRDKLAREWCEYTCEMYGSDKSDDEGYKEWVGLFAGSHRDLAERLKEARRGYEARQQKREQVNGVFKELLVRKQFSQAAETLKSGDGGYVAKEHKDELAREWCEHTCEMYDSDKSDEEGYKEWEGLFAGSHKDLAERLEEARKGYEARQHKRDQINGEFRNYISEKMYLKAAEILKSSDEGYVAKEHKDELAREWSKSICEGFESGTSNIDGGYQKWMEIFENSYQDLKGKMEDKKKRCDVNRAMQNYVSGKMYQKASEVLESDDRVYVSEENKYKLAEEWCEHICEMYDSDKPDKEGHEKWVKLFAEPRKDLASRMGKKRSEYEERENRARVNALFRQFREEKRYLEAAGILEGKDGSLVQADERKKLAQQWGEWIMNNLCREDVKKQHLSRWRKNFDKSEQQFTEKLREEYGTVENIMREVKDEHYNSASRLIKGLKCLENKKALIDELLPKWREGINQKLTQGELTDELPKYVEFINVLKKEHILPSGHRNDDINLHASAKETLRRVFSIKKRVEISTYLEVYDKAFPGHSLELDEKNFMAAPPEIRDLLSERADVKSWLDNITPRIASALEIGKSVNKKLAMWLARSDEQRRKDFSKALLNRVDFIVKTWKDKLNDKTENDPDKLYKQMRQDVEQFIAPLGLTGVMDSAKNCLGAWVKKDERWRKYRYIWEEKAKEVGWLKEDGTMFEEEDRTIYYLSVKMIRKNQQKDAPKYEATIKHSSMDLENKENTEELKVVEDEESEPFWCDFWGTNSTTIEWYLQLGSWWRSEKEQKGEKKLSEKEVRSAMKEPIKLNEEIMIQFIEKKP